MVAAAKSKPDLPLLRRASKAFLVTGSYLIASAIANLVLSYLQIFYILSSSFPYVTNVNLSPFTFATFVLSCITLSFSLLLGYYAVKIGSAYDSGSLRAGGALYFFMSAVSVTTSAVSIVSGSSASLSSTGLPIAYISTLLVDLVLFGITLAAYVLLILGASNMKNKTGVDSFNTAMILFILFFIPIVFPVGLIIFGMGLSRLASMGEKKMCPKCGKEVEPYALFCKFCGTELNRQM